MTKETLAAHKLQLWFRKLNAKKQSVIDFSTADVLYTILQKGGSLRIIKSTPELYAKNSYIISKFFMEMRKPRNFLSLHGYKTSVFNTQSRDYFNVLARYSLGLYDEPGETQIYFIVNNNGKVLGLFEFCPPHEYNRSLVFPIKQGDREPNKKELYPDNVKFFGIYLFEDARNQSIGKRILTFLASQGEPIHSLVSVANEVSQAVHNKTGFEALARVAAEDPDEEDSYVYRPKPRH